MNNNVKSSVNMQAAFDYALYMMAGSYFKKATLSGKSRFIIDNMYINYKELGDEKQCRMENACISYVEKVLIGDENKPGFVPSEMWNEEVTVRIVRSNTAEKPSFKLCFGSGKMGLVLESTYRSRKPFIQARYTLDAGKTWQKTEAPKKHEEKAVKWKRNRILVWHEESNEAA